MVDTVNSVTKRFLRSFSARRMPTTFLTGLLSFDPLTNVHNSEEVTIDIQRLAESISITQPSRAGGYRDVTSEKFTNKSFKPPVNADSHSLDAFKLIKRQFGQNPFDDPDFVTNARTESARNMALISDGIMRTVELQASQVMQTGAITLTDSGGATVYTINYGPKATHFPTVGTSWSNVAADALGDLEALAEVIRDDGLVDVTDIIMGDGAFRNFLNNTAVKAQADIRRFNRIVEFTPTVVGNGAKLQGEVSIGNYKFRIWTYNGRYEDPQNPGTKIKFVADDKVIMLALEADANNNLRTRIDLSYGRFLPIRQPLPEARQFIPPSISAGMFRMDTNAWFSNDGFSLTVGAGIRPLVIPVGIDTYGCLDTII